MDTHRFNQTNRNSGPVCKFGPGGEYISYWPANQPDTRSNPLARLLATIATMVGATIDAELMAEIDAGREINDIVKAKPSKDDVGAEKKHDNTDYAPTTTGTKSNSPIREQPMLFSDDCRISPGAKRKPAHRIRAYRRTSKKKSARRPTAQGTLFEAHTAGQSAA